MNKLIRYIAGLPKHYVTLLLLGVLAIVTFLDYVTGFEISFSIFYLLPIALSTWTVNRQSGLIVSIIAAFLWWWADLAAGQTYSSTAIPYWNALVRLGFFTTVTLILHELRQVQIRQEELKHFIIHDLRSPLSSIIMGLETMHEVEEGLDKTTQQEIVLLSLVSSKRLLDLVNSLLDLARLENKQMPIMLEAVAVGEVVASAFERVQLSADRVGVSLHMQLPKDGLVVWGDRDLIERILINLVSNSIKFSEQGGAITVKTQVVDEDKITFSVMDEGRDIPAEWATKVFDKYAQIEARRQGKLLGTGLGLAFCREAVEALGGSIWVEANQLKELKGTTITFLLPGQKPC